MAGLKYRIGDEYTNAHNQTIGLTGGMFSVLSRVTNVLCDDGKRRTAFVHTMQPNDAWSIDARVNIGKTSSLGRLYLNSDGEYLFRAYTKN